MHWRLSQQKLNWCLTWCPYISTSWQCIAEYRLDQRRVPRQVSASSPRKQLVVLSSWFIVLTSRSTTYPSTPYQYENANTCLTIYQVIVALLVRTINQLLCTTRCLVWGTSYFSLLFQNWRSYRFKKSLRGIS